jgi:hypothetical protein
MRLRNRNLSARTAILPVTAFALMTAVPAGATILTFDQTRAVSGGPVVPTFGGASVPDGYGDRVTGATVDVPGGTFTYGEAGEGFTPNVVADYFSGSASLVGPGVSLWEDSYGDLLNVLFGNNNSSFLGVRLTADPGFSVGLYGFDLGGWPNADYVVDAVRVFGGTTLLFEQTSVLVEGNFTGPRRTTFAFATPLFADELLIEIAFGNLPGSQHDNIGLDNIRFGQDPPPLPSGGDPTTVPEPGTLALVLMALVANQVRRRRATTPGRSASAQASR